MSSQPDPTPPPAITTPSPPLTPAPTASGSSPGALLSEGAGPTVEDLVAQDPVVKRAILGWKLARGLGISSGGIVLFALGVLLAEGGYLARFGFEGGGGQAGILVATEDKKRLDELGARVGKIEEQMQQEAHAQKVRDEAEAKLSALREEQRQRDEQADDARLSRIEERLERIVEALPRPRR